MLQYLRSHQKNIMLVTTFVIVVSFSVWGVPNCSKSIHQTGPGQRAVFDFQGEEITEMQFQRMVRNFQVASQALGLFSFARDISGVYKAYEVRGGAPMDGIINLLALRKHAADMGIKPSDQEIADAFENLPAFKDENGNMNADAIKMFRAQLNANGLNDSDVQTMLADSITLERLKRLVAGGIAPHPSDVKDTYGQAKQVLAGSILAFPLEEAKKSVTVTDEELKKYHEEHRSEYKTDEKRAIRYVFMPRPKDVEKLEAEKRDAAIRAYNESVTKFYEPVSENPAKFEELAKAQELTVKDTPLFTATTAPEEIKGVAELTEAVFTTPYSKDKFVGDPVKTTDGYYIFQFKPEHEPAAEMTFDQAKEQVRTTLVETKAREAVTKMAEEAKGKLEAAMKEEPNKPAKTFAAAAEELKLKTIPFSNITMSKFPTEKYFGEAMRAGVEMKVNGISKAIPVEDGAILVHLEKREMYKSPEAAQDMSQTADRLKSTYALRLMEGYFRKWREEGKIKFHQALNTEG